MKNKYELLILEMEGFISSIKDMEKDLEVRDSLVGINSRYNDMRIAMNYWKACYEKIAPKVEEYEKTIKDLRAETDEMNRRIEHWINRHSEDTKALKNEIEQLQIALKVLQNRCEIQNNSIKYWYDYYQEEYAKNQKNEKKGWFSR